MTGFLISFSPRRVPVSELSINRLERLSESPGGGTVRSVLNNLGFPAYKVTSQSAHFRYSRAVLCKAIFQCILSEIRPPHRRCLTVGPAKSPLLGSLSKGAFQRRTSLHLKRRFNRKFWLFARNGRVVQKAPCWMAHEAEGQEKERDYIIHKL